MDFLCEITAVTGEEAVVVVKQTQPSQGEPSLWVTVYQALPNWTRWTALHRKLSKQGQSVVPVLTSGAFPGRMKRPRTRTGTVAENCGGSRQAVRPRANPAGVPVAAVCQGHRAGGAGGRGYPILRRRGTKPGGSGWKRQSADFHFYRPGGRVFPGGGRFGQTAWGQNRLLRPAEFSARKPPPLRRWPP